MTRKFLLPSLIVAAVLTGGVAQAQIYYVPTYVATNNNNGPITDMVEFWQDPSGGGVGSLNGIGEPGFSITGQGTTSTFSDLPKPRLPEGLFVLGLYTEVAADPNPGQQHVVVFMNNYAASLTANIAWGTIFLNTNEDQLIADLHAMTATEDSTAINNVFNFATGDAMNIPDSASQTGVTSAWIAPPPNGVAASGTIMMWSNGQAIGTFTASAQAVPEPFSIGALGLGAVALLRRRKSA
jgi:hypothetical protein